MNPQRRFIAKVIEWAGTQRDLLGVILVGSCARGEERDDSDVDLALIANDPASWLEHDDWIHALGSPRNILLEDYGLVQSRRVFYESGVEVEFGITSRDWVRTDPIDDGTRQVISDGCRVLDDKAGLLECLLDALRGDRPNDEEPIHIVDYNPSWSEMFERERGLIETTLDGWIHGGVHHVGSTAVAGLAAKPVIDIMIGVEDLSSARACIPLLESIGYCYFPYHEYMHWFCKPSPYNRTHHVHIIESTHPQFRARLAFRDALRRDPNLQAEYELLKRRLAEEFRNDREAYTDGKTEFITRVVGRSERS